MTDERNNRPSWLPDNIPSQRMDPGEKPRKARNSERPGEYKLVIRAEQSEVDPGGKFLVEVFITGYGEIHGPKLSFYPTTYFLDTEESSLRYDLSIEAEGHRGYYRYGQTELLLHETGGTFLLGGGLKAGQWDSSTMFFDITSSDAREYHGTSRIATEGKFERAPFEILCKAQERVPSGVHSLRFFYRMTSGCRDRAAPNSMYQFPRIVLIGNWQPRSVCTALLDAMV